MLAFGYEANSRRITSGSVDAASAPWPKRQQRPSHFAPFSPLWALGIAGVFSFGRRGNTGHPFAAQASAAARAGLGVAPSVGVLGSWP